MKFLCKEAAFVRVWEKGIRGNGAHGEIPRHRGFLFVTRRTRQIFVLFAMYTEMYFSIAGKTER